MSYSITIEQITLENGDLVNVINARELHAALEVRTRFNRWINRRIQSNNYSEEFDYWIEEEEHMFLNYLVTVDMAQELAALERSHLSKPVRNYVIKIRNERLDFLQFMKYLQESQIHDLNKEIIEIQTNHLKYLLNQYSEVQELHYVDGYINFLSEYNLYYDTVHLTAGDIFSSRSLLEKAISLAEQLIKIGKVGELAND